MFGEMEIKMLDDGQVVKIASKGGRGFGEKAEDEGWEFREGE